MEQFKRIYIMADDYPSRIFIDDRSYQYFLGCYLPCELYELNRSQLIELNKIRLELGLVNWDYNSYMVRLLFSEACDNKNQGRLLDFGIGNGFSIGVLSHENDWEIYGIDMNDYTDKNLYDKNLYDWKTITKKGIKFDAIISSFVFDFGVTEQDIQNLYDCLNPGSRLAFNVYKFWDRGKHFFDIMGIMNKVGFEYRIKQVAVPKQFKIRHGKDVIVVAKKSK